MLNQQNHLYAIAKNKDIKKPGQKTTLACKYN